MNQAVKPLSGVGFLGIGLALLWWCCWGAGVCAQVMATPSAETSKAANADTIRVGLAQSGLTQYVHKGLQAQVTTGGTLLVKALPGGQVLWQGAGPVSLSRKADGWSLSLLPAQSANALPVPVLPPPPPLWFSANGLRLEAAAGGMVQLPALKRPGGVPSYRGVVDLLPDASQIQGFTVVNTLLMQDYLKAVVPNELPIRFGFEAVKAQSVAARNYALRPRETFWKTFDICDSQYCQAYYGAQTETPETSRAVDETAGLVLLHNHQYALTVFSSTAGGVTEAYANVFSDPVTKQFPSQPIAYLNSFADAAVRHALPQGVGDLSTDAAAKAFWTRYGCAQL
jgi:hypothetical protein